MSRGWYVERLQGNRVVIVLNDDNDVLELACDYLRNGERFALAVCERHNAEVRGILDTLVVLRAELDAAGVT